MTTPASAEGRGDRPAPGLDELFHERVNKGGLEKAFAASRVAVAPSAQGDRVVFINFDEAHPYNRPDLDLAATTAAALVRAEAGRGEDMSALERWRDHIGLGLLHGRMLAELIDKMNMPGQGFGQDAGLYLVTKIVDTHARPLRLLDFAYERKTLNRRYSSAVAHAAARTAKRDESIDPAADALMYSGRDVILNVSASALNFFLNRDYKITVAPSSPKALLNLAAHGYMALVLRSEAYNHPDRLDAYSYMCGLVDACTNLVLPLPKGVTLDEAVRRTVAPACYQAWVRAYDTVGASDRRPYQKPSGAAAVGVDILKPVQPIEKAVAVGAAARKGAIVIPNTPFPSDPEAALRQVWQEYATAVKDCTDSLGALARREIARQRERAQKLAGSIQSLLHFYDNSPSFRPSERAALAANYQDLLVAVAQGSLSGREEMYELGKQLEGGEDLSWHEIARAWALNRLQGSKVPQQTFGWVQTRLSGGLTAYLDAMNREVNVEGMVTTERKIADAARTITLDYLPASDELDLTQVDIRHEIETMMSNEYSEQVITGWAVLMAADCAHDPDNSIWPVPKRFTGSGARRLEAQQHGDEITAKLDLLVEKVFGEPPRRLHEHEQRILRECLVLYTNNFASQPAAVKNMLAKRMNAMVGNARIDAGKLPEKARLVLQAYHLHLKG